MAAAPRRVHYGTRAASIEDAQRLLIVRAGYAWGLNSDHRYRDLAAAAELDGYGRVAADILGLCLVHAAFTSAIRTTCAELPCPLNTGARAREATAALRADWEARFTAAVLAKLGKGTL
jgi:hypothetical protein